MIACVQDVPPSQKKKSGEETSPEQGGRLYTGYGQVTIILRFIIAICIIVVFSFSNIHQDLCSQIKYVSKSI